MSDECLHGKASPRLPWQVSHNASASAAFSLTAALVGADSSWHATHPLAVQCGLALASSCAGTGEDQSIATMNAILANSSCLELVIEIVMVLTMAYEVTGSREFALVLEAQFAITPG